MIIFGVRTTESTLSFGAFLCPRCRTSQDYREVVHRRWFTLYFIPLIPLGRVGEQVECLGCFSRFTPDVLGDLPQTKSGVDVIVAACADEPSGMAPGISQGSKSLPPQTVSFRTAKASGLAITSLILGALSFPLLCAVGLSLFTSLGSIITGHFALKRIQRSSGRLTGTRIAQAGLVAGYAMLVGTTLIWGFIGYRIVYAPYTPLPSTDSGLQEAMTNTADTRLRDAEHQVLAPGSAVTATGNTKEARQLAEEYSESLKLARDALFTEGRKRIFSLTHGEFIVHCERSPGRCLFLVHVPDYRDFEKDAKETLATAAWELAQRHTRGTMDRGDELAVALRGTLLYGAILVGPVGPHESTTPAFDRAERDALLAFFPDPVPDVRDMASTGAHSAAPALAPDDSSGKDSASPAPDPEGPSAGSIPPNYPPGFPGFPPHPLSEFPQTPPYIPGPIPPGPYDVPPAVPPQARPSDTGGVRATAGTGMRQAKTMATRLPGSSLGSADENHPSQPPGLLCQFPDLGWSVRSLAFAPDRPWLAVGKLDAMLLMLDVSSGRQLYAESRRDEVGQIQCVAFSPDGRHVLAGGDRGAVFAWDVDDAGSLQSARPLHGHEKAVTCLATSAAAHFVLTGSMNGELKWQPYDRPNSSPRMLKALQRPVLALHLPSSGMEAAATDGDRLLFFDLRSGEITRTVTLGGRSAFAAAFSPDGSRLAVSLGRAIQVWDLHNGVAAVGTRESNEMQWSLAFTPDAQKLVSGGSGKVAVWTLDEAEPAIQIPLGSILYIKPLAVAENRADDQGRFLLAAIPDAAGQTLSVIRLP